MKGEVSLIVLKYEDEIKKYGFNGYKEMIKLSCFFENKKKEKS